MLSGKRRIKALFSRTKLPGWFFVIAGAIWQFLIGLPDWKGRLDFWVGAAKAMPGYVGYAAAIVDSRWFPLGLFLSGILYITFVGESKRAVRHPILPILGWAVFGLTAVAFWSVLVVGYAIMHPPLPQQVKGGQVQKQNRLDITADQLKRLLAALDHVPPGQTYYVAFEVLRDCMDCEIFANNLSGPWGTLRGWHPVGEVNRRIYPRRGIMLAWNQNQCPEAEMKLITNALTAAEIPFASGPVPDYLRNAPAGHCLIVVGVP
jgi:hypothetical protein